MFKLLLLALLPATALAQAPVRANYEAYARGFNVLDVSSAFEVNQHSYAVRVRTRTVGAAAAVVSFDITTTVTGTFAGNRPHPIRYDSNGAMRGQPRVTLMDWRGDVPEVTTLTPPNTEDDREEVPAADTVRSVDTLTAMADLVGHVSNDGKCEGQLLTFDGRRLAQLTARTAGMETLEPTSRSTFTGPALRCDFVGLQTGGYKRDEDIQIEKRPQRGSAWFARTVPGGPMIPVKIVFTNRILGDATMYLVSSGAQ